MATGFSPGRTPRNANAQTRLPDRGTQCLLGGMNTHCSPLSPPDSTTQNSRSTGQRITGHARLAGVAAWPVTHSRSPLLHNHWLTRYGIDGAYVPLAIAPERFEQALRGLQAAHFAGLNVTLPHKEAAFALCDELDDTARQAGAVNTIIFHDNRIIGRNTDGYGFMENLRAHDVDPTTGPALVVGAGGAARAVVAALLAANVPVTLTNRTPARAQAMAASLPGLRVLDWNHRHAALADHALAVHATSAGIANKESGTAGGNDSAALLDFSHASPRLVVTDLNYVPLQTPILTAAHAHGLRIVGGLGMLLHQARPGFAAWFGRDPQVDQAAWDLLAADIKPR